MPDFSYDNGDDGTMDNNAGRLKQPSSAPSLLKSTIAAEEISRNLCHIIGKLLDLVLWFFTFKCIVSGNEGTCDSDGNMSPGNTNTVNGEKTI